MVGMNIMNHAEESMWYKRQRDERKNIKGSVVQGKWTYFYKLSPGCKRSINVKGEKKKKENHMNQNGILGHFAALYWEQGLTVRYAYSYTKPKPN